MVAETIEGRMLCASRVAYDVSDEGTIPPLWHKQYFHGVGFIEEPQAFVEGLRHINAAFVGENHDGLLLAFRGTLPGPHPESLPEITTVRLKLEQIQLVSGVEFADVRAIGLQGA